jgi:hypothetical protein
MMLRRQARRWRMGLATLAGRRPQGFFIPYRYAAGAAATPPPYGPVAARLEAAEPAFRTVLARIDAYAPALAAIGEHAGPPAPRWGQGWFPRLDAAAAYAIVRDRRPARIVEVGSGHSTRFLARAAADGGLATAITAIDPVPRADLARLPVCHVAAPVQHADPAPFAALGPGDVLFIDSSHVAMPGTDVDLLLNGVLPALPAGVLVHVHDVFLPDGYPAAWRWRGYNEQLLVAALVAGGGYAPLFASRYVASRLPDAVGGTVLPRLPLWPGVPETSLWLEKTVPPAGTLPAPPRVAAAGTGRRGALTQG